MTEKQFRTLALALPETQEQPHMERTSFRVRGKIIATLGDDGQANLHVAPREKLYGLVAERPGVFVELGGWSRLGWVGVVLSKVTRADLEPLLVSAWRHRASKRAQLAYDGDGDRDRAPPKKTPPRRR